MKLCVVKSRGKELQALFASTPGPCFLVPSPDAWRTRRVMGMGSCSSVLAAAGGNSRGSRSPIPVYKPQPSLNVDAVAPCVVVLPAQKQGGNWSEKRGGEGADRRDTQQCGEDVVSSGKLELGHVPGHKLGLGGKPVILASRKATVGCGYMTG